MDISSSSLERVGYVQCNFCNTILAVSVPGSSSIFSLVTVRCGHCCNLLSVTMPSPNNLLHPPLPLQHFILHQNEEKEKWNSEDGIGSSKIRNAEDDDEEEVEEEEARLTHIRPPEKRQRVPSAYNQFIKEEIQRIKASNPDISHRQAFSTAAKNWAHYPHIHYGLNVENKQANLDHHVVGGEAAQKSIGLC
ncbi:unnamed protein product [Cuscuta campestris]|uniref:Uncharacterized protein n=1 Tax=Cuscuta campestris TaxID=132261 RepID=A0A484MYL2_9ASTE|nr:unnamed protein product [Cuscuta campestris]